jgi:hypothetical protein
MQKYCKHCGATFNSNNKKKTYCQVECATKAKRITDEQRRLSKQKDKGFNETGYSQALTNWINNKDELLKEYKSIYLYMLKFKMIDHEKFTIC